MYIRWLSCWLLFLIRASFGVILPNLLPDRSLLLLFTQHSGDIFLALLHQAGIIPLSIDLPRLTIRLPLHIRPYGLAGGVQCGRVHAFRLFPQLLILRKGGFEFAPVLGNCVEI